jgi:NADPH:quinone reductase-like Zn-dependent oxidoreductase
LYEYGGPENLKYEDDAPDPALSADSVLVETSATSLNPIDWQTRSGARQKDFPLKLRAILGKDVSGVVRAVGHNIRTFKPGDRVLAWPRPGAILSRDFTGFKKCMATLDNETVNKL